MRCKECYYRVDDQCRRYPPVFIGRIKEDCVVFGQPVIYDEFWCGEFAEFVGIPELEYILRTEDSKDITTEGDKEK